MRVKDQGMQPARTVCRADFDLKPFLMSDDRIATGQVLSVLLPYAGLWYLAYVAHAESPWWLVPIGAVMVLFLARSFALMHDCGHYALFRKARVNRAVGFLLSVINGLPQYPWSRGHAYHHRHNGNWERYRGPAAVCSVDRFLSMGPFRQWAYQTLRHPLMLLPGGLFYLVVKPRVQLLCGLVEMAFRVVGSLARGRWRQAWSLESRFWYTPGEFWDLLANNIAVVGAWILMGEALGHGFFWAFYAPVMMVTAAIFICVFYIQHNFPGSYAHRTEGWDYLQGALAGTSHFKLPAILNWFTADIGYHNIHHLCERIPNYRLAACHRAHAALLAEVKVLHLRDIPTCYGYILWDAAGDRLTTVAEVRRRIHPVVVATPQVIG